MATENDTTNHEDPRYQQVIDLQIQLEEIEGVANLAADACADDDPGAMSAFGVINRRAKAIREQLNELLPQGELPECDSLAELGRLPISSEPEAPAVPLEKPTTDDPHLERGQYALLVGDEPYGIVSGIRGIAGTLEGPLFDDIEDENVQNVVMALKQLADRLYDAAYNAPHKLQNKVRNVIEAPDSRAEAMAKRLHEKGFMLWSDPTTPNTFGVSDSNFSRMRMAICSIDEIDRWLETQAEGGAA